MRILEFGRTHKGEKARLFELNNHKGMTVAVSDYGATIVSIVVPDGNGGKKDVVLGYDDVSGYESGELFFGACIGRAANRIGKAECTIAGKTYGLTKNDFGNTLHGGCDFYSKRMWEVQDMNDTDDDHITFLLHSSHLDQGMPGNLDVSVTYSLSSDNELTIQYQASCDADTIVNLTNHSYFNLDGHNAGSILRHSLTVDADYFTETDDGSIPTGKFIPVEDTPLDFRTWKEVGRDISAPYEQLTMAHGYDHNYVLKNEGRLGRVAQVRASQSGICMEVWTNQPGLQIYTANYVDHEKGKNEAIYDAREAICLETQYFPDGIHHENFPDTVLKSGKPYEKITRYCFSCA